MTGVSTTIRIGDTAPDFVLYAANRFDQQHRPVKFSLRKLIADGPLIVEFLRGTW